MGSFLSLSLAKTERETDKSSIQIHKEGGGETISKNKTNQTWSLCVVFLREAARREFRFQQPATETQRSLPQSQSDNMYPKFNTCRRATKRSHPRSVDNEAVTNIPDLLLAAGASRRTRKSIAGGNPGHKTETKPTQTLISDAGRSLLTGAAVSLHSP